MTQTSTTPVIHCDAVWTYLKFCYICSGSNLTMQCPFFLCCDLLHHLTTCYAFLILSYICFPPPFYRWFFLPVLFLLASLLSFKDCSQMGSKQTVEVWLWNTVLKSELSSPSHRRACPIVCAILCLWLSCYVFLVMFAELLWCDFTGRGGKSVTN